MKIKHIYEAILYNIRAKQAGFDLRAEPGVITLVLFNDRDFQRSFETLDDLDLFLDAWENRGRYAPPANIVPHFLHFHIPVSVRLTRRRPHLGQG